MEPVTLLYAEVDSDNIVQTIGLIAENDTFDENGNINDSVAEEFLQYHYKSSNRWIRCWQNPTSDEERFAFPGVGSKYDPDFDIFYGPQPEPHWTFDTSTKIWNPPADAPEKPTLTDEQISKNYVVGWDFVAYDNGEYPWTVYRIPSTDCPDLTDDERQSGCTYHYDETSDSWILSTPAFPAPSLTEDEQERGCNYYWNQIDYEKDNTTGWVLSCMR